VRRLLALLLALLPLAAGEALADGKETLDAARAAYYSLRREGLEGFSCLATPNWDAVLAPRRRADPAAADKAYTTLSALTFGIEATPGRRAKVMHTDPPGGLGSTEKETEALKLVTSGVEQTLTGFFDAWGPFVMTTPIPPPTAEVTEARYLWVVDFNEGKTAVGMVMRHDYTIEATSLVSDTFSSVIQPQFVKSPKGLLLTALQGQYRQLPTGSAYSLQLRVEYQDVTGFLLPKHLWVSSNNGKAVTQMDLSFGTCQAQRR
jgi:hypothetical protein